MYENETWKYISPPQSKSFRYIRKMYQTHRESIKCKMWVKRKEDENDEKKKQTQKMYL